MHSSVETGNIWGRNSLQYCTSTRFLLLGLCLGIVVLLSEGWTVRFSVLFSSHESIKILSQNTLKDYSLLKANTTTVFRGIVTQREGKMHNKTTQQGNSMKHCCVSDCKVEY